MNEHAIDTLIRDLIKANDEKHAQYEIKRQKMLAHLRAVRSGSAVSRIGHRVWVMCNKPVKP
jgi:hypothetical protein